MRRVSNVVGGEDDQRLVPLADLLEPLEQPSQLRVHLRAQAVVHRLAAPLRRLVRRLRRDNRGEVRVDVTLLLRFRGPAANRLQLILPARSSLMRLG